MKPYLGIIHDRNNNHDAAIADYNAALTLLNPGAGFIHNNLGWALCDLERYDEVFQAFQVLSHHPDCGVRPVSIFRLRGIQEHAGRHFQKLGNRGNRSC